jgi:hypothetical protein
VDAHKIVSDFWNIINSDKVSVNLLVDNDVQVVDVDGMEGCGVENSGIRE